MKRFIKNTAVVFGLTILISGCESFFNLNPDDLLLEENYPSTVAELYSGYLGISAKVQNVADQAMFLEGLRGDFLEPTQNATQEMIDVYYHNERPDNKFASPVGYYAVILNANDYIIHASKFYEANPNSIEESKFKALIGGALRYKSWAYLQIAKLYGQAVWIDDQLSEFKDISSYQVLNFEQIIQKCIDLIEVGIEINGKMVDGKGNILWSVELFPGASRDYSWDCINPMPEILLGELYLFSGNFQLAFDNLMTILRYGASENMWEITKSEYNNEWINLFRGYVRKEGIFILSYNYNLKQTNRVVEYFSNQAPNKYYLRPSAAIMETFNNQTQSNGNKGDLYRGNNKTFMLRGNDWVVYKFISAHLTSETVFRNDVIINLYRASDLHLMLAEALGGLGRIEEAMAFLDGGLETYYNTAQGVFMAPFQDYPTLLYASSGDGTTQGVRGRVALNRVNAWKYPLSNPTAADKRKLDELLLNEISLELAGEAKAYFSMIRMAKRWNDPSILADRVSTKYPEGLRAQMRERLMNPDNWFIKTDLVVK